LKNKSIIDILPKRYEHYLCDYFRKMARGKVRFVVSDMCGAYSEIAKTYFKSSTYVIDKYHWIILNTNKKHCKNDKAVI